MARPTTSDTDIELVDTKNDLDVDIRRQVIDLLNQRLADCVDLQTQCKQAHWNVKGPAFIGLHRLFDRVNEDVEDYVDLIAERIVQLGGTAMGTARMVAERTTLLDYPATIHAGEEHVAALSDVLAQFGRTVRIGIDEMNELNDADSADLLTEISRGIDKWLWMVEAHLHGQPVIPGPAHSRDTGARDTTPRDGGVAERARSRRPAVSHRR
ncbi:MAG TPA: DNA starvation/stationary phase protection protein Dps [Gemmatimonadales bacterium]|nr:DNA starvation/stationary phase protection protein Dps [Gemmatimonadales bacterium]